MSKIRKINGHEFIITSDRLVSHRPAFCLKCRVNKDYFDSNPFMCPEST